WSWYNMVMLVIASFVCIEQPRYRKDERFKTYEATTLVAEDEAHGYTMLDCSVGGMLFAGEAPVPRGSKVAVRLGGASFDATIVRPAPDAFAVQLESESARDAMIRYLYSRHQLGTSVQVRAWEVTMTILQRLFR